MISKFTSLKWLSRFQNTYWFIPTVTTVLAVVTSFGVWQLDHWLEGQGIELVPQSLQTDANGAMSILSTIAGSSISVASLVFSITLVVLSMAASQMGPRLLQNFMKTNQTQTVLGAFIGTFLYCLLIMTTVSDNTETTIPHLAVLLGMGLGVISFGLLIYFIHHVLVFIQISRALKDVSEDITTAFNRILLSVENETTESQKLSGDSTDEVPNRNPDYRLKAPVSGYVELLEIDDLVKHAKTIDALIRVIPHPGQFLVKGTPMLDVWTDTDLDEEQISTLLKNVRLASQRSNIQDVEFAIDQLVEVALRALSPGINDSFTAINCIDQLASGLAEVVGKRLPTPYYFDDAKELRLIAELYSYNRIVDAAFHAIRRNTRNNVSVTERLMQSVTTIHSLSSSQAYRSALMRHARLIYSEAEQHFQNSQDLKAFQERYKNFVLSRIKPIGSF